MNELKDGLLKKALEDLHKGEADLERAEEEIAQAETEVEAALRPVYVFFVGADRFTTEHEHLTGAQIKAKVPGWVAANSLELEGEGREPNRVIADHETVHFSREHPTHFIAVPPASFGANQ